MSPTSYQTAPPRTSIIATARCAVKPSPPKGDSAAEMALLPQRQVLYLRILDYDWQIVLGVRWPGLAVILRHFATS
jgi:hypothetical protein